MRDREARDVKLAESKTQAKSMTLGITALIAGVLLVQFQLKTNLL